MSPRIKPSPPRHDAKLHPVFSAMNVGSSELAPAARRFCLDCRTPLATRAQCDGGKAHRVVDLATVEGRVGFFNEVWGPASLRRSARQAAKAGGAGAAVDSCANASACDGCSGIGDAGELGAVIAGILIAAVVAVAIWWVVSKIIEYVRMKRAQLKPKGALIGAPRGGGAAVYGTVRSAKSADGVAAVALQLLQSRLGANAVMLRYASTDGMEIALDDGSTVRIDPGRVRLDGTFEAVDDPIVAHDLIDATVGEPLKDDEGYELIPFNVCQRVTLKVGDRVALFGPLTVAMDRSDPRMLSAFRDISRVLVPADLASLAKVER